MSDSDIEMLARHLAEKSGLSPDGNALPFREPQQTLAGKIYPLESWIGLPAPAWKLFVPIATEILDFLNRRRATAR